MGKRTKRALSLFLVLVIIVTSVGYTPPINSLASSGDNQSIEDILWDEKATPSEADYSYKATPSEADSLTNVTKSEAEKNFVKVEPKDEEIPKFYSRATDLKNQFWQFEDRYGVVQYRDYGYFNGETESPHWYCLTSDGNLDIDDNSQYSDNVDLEDEYITLAPYLYESVQPDQKAWTNLSWKLLKDSESIFLFDREESKSFKNWNQSTYSIWSVNGLLESEESKDDEIQNTDLGYFFYGKIINEHDSIEQWYYADIDGRIWSMMQFNTMMLMAEAPTTCKLTFDANGGTIYNNSTYEKDLTINTAMTYSDMNAIKSNVNRAGYTFDGWNYQSDGSGSNFYDSTKVTSDTTIYAKWRKNQYTVMFYRNYPIGDTTTYKYKSVYFGDPIGTFMDPFPVGLGMEFKGWYLNKYCSGDPVTVDMLMPGETLNLYGKWESFDVTYKMHYGYGIDESTLPTEIKTKSTVIGRDLAKYFFPDLVNSSKLYAPGYVDGYWTDTSDMNASGAVIFPEASGSWYPINHITDIYLKKSVKRVVFDLYYPPYDYPKNQYSSSPWPIANGTKYGDIIWPKDLNAIMAYVGSDKKFVGLFSDPGQTKQIDLSSPICPPDKQDKKDLVRYTVYLGIANESSKITFKDWDGSILSEKTVNYGDPIDVPSDPVRSGYKFIGWDTEINENTKFGNDTVITAQYVESGFRINLYANGGKFKEINDGTGDVVLFDSKTIKFDDISDEKYVVEKSNEFLNSQLKNLKREGYLYDLYDNQTGGNLITSITESNLLNGKIDIYAQWTPSYLVTFKDWDGKIINEQYIKQNQNAIPPEDPKRDGYSFTGWSIPYDNITSNLTITANYETLLKIRFLRCNYNQADSADEFNYEEIINAGTWPDSNKEADAVKMWDSKANLEKVKFPNLKNEGDIFLGWARDGEISSDISFKGFIPQMFRRPRAITQTLSSGASKPYATNNTYGNVVPGFAIIPGGTEVESKVFMGPNSNYQPDRVYKGVWLPEDKPSLILVNGFKDYYGGFGFRYIDETNFSKYSLNIINNAEMIESISIAQNFGDKFKDLKLLSLGISDIGIPKALTNCYEGNGVSNSNTTYYDVRKLIGYFSEPDGKGKRLDNNYIFNKVADKYYAYFVPKDQKFNFTFKDENGNVISSGKMNADGNIINLPQAPQKPGYIFIGWKDSSGGNSTTNSVLRDTDFIPEYQKIQNFTLTLNGNVGYFSNNENITNISIQKEAGDALNATIYGNIENLPYRQYYSFDGWYEYPEDKGNNSDKLSNSIENYMPDHDVTYFAHWIKTYKQIIWKDVDGNQIGGGWYPIDNSQTIVPPAAPNKPGYHFDDWSSDPKDSNDDIEIYPIYSKNKYTLTLNFNNGEQNDTFDINFEDSIQQKLNESSSKLNKRFYSFEKWQVHGNESAEVPELMPDNSLTLDAKWKRVSSLVTWKDWDGRIIDEKEVSIGGSLENPQDPTRVGYDFVGWSDVASNVTDHMIIVAQYSSNKYLLTLDGNGGTLNGQNLVTKEFSYNESLDQTLIDGKDILLRTYYVFDGWYTEPLGGNRYSDNGNAMPASALTIYAHWARSSSLVTYKDWNGTVLKTQEVPIGKNATPPEVPERAGYTFAGWDKISTDIQDHTIITAKYTINGYKLTLDGNGGMIDGKATKEQGFVYNESIDQMLKDGEDNIKRKYFNFDGWYTEAVGGDKYTYIGNTMPSSNLTIYAHWVRNSSLVTYKDWDGKVLKTQEVEIGTDATPPENPTRPGYTFTGWDHDSTGIKNHTIITAQYSINTYTLILNGNGGTVGGNKIKEQTVAYGESFDQILIDERIETSREYYDFDGWFTLPVAGNEYTYSGNKMPNTNLTIYAHWVRSSSLVTYKDWTGAAIKSQKVLIGEDATPPEAPSRTGYTFVGWDKSSANIQDHTIITAKYSVNKYKVTLDGNGGTFDGEPIKTQEINYGELFDQLLINGKNIVNQNYYTFDGWYSSPIGGECYSYSENVMPESDITIYAHWTRSSNLVTYKDWDGTILKSQDVAVGSNATPPAEPKRVGYTFTNWDSLSTNIQTDTVITAQYMINHHRLTLYGNDGTIGENAIEEFEFDYGESFDQALLDSKNLVRRNYYIFDGWYTLPEDGYKYSYNGNKMPDSDVAVYAHWVRSYVTVTYKDWDGTILKTQNVEEGSDAAPPVDPERVGYTFVDWDKPSTDIQADTVITAQYSINSHTLSLDSNGGLINGSITKDHSLSYGESFDQILTVERCNAIREGYTFDGWYTHPTEGNSYTYSGNSMPDSNIIIYAHWIPNKYTIHFEKNLLNIEKNPVDRAVIYGGVIGELPVLNAKGYTFDGWYTEAIGGNKIGADTPSPLGDKTYYGHWILNWIDNGDGTHTRPGTDNMWNTDDDEIWQNGPDELPGTDDDYKKIDENPSPEPTKPEPTKPEPSKASEDSSEDNPEVTYPVIDSKIKPTIPDMGGTFTVNPNNQYDVTYTKPDGTLASDEWVGDGKEWYHVGTNGKLNYDWYLEGQKTWYKLNKDPGEKFGAALIGWNYESMDDKMYFFDPKTTQMLTGWQNIDGNWYYFTPANEAQTYFGNNSKGWLYDSTRPGKPYGSMYKNEKTPDGYKVDENGKWIK